MKNLTYAYRKALSEIALGMDDLMADLEDIRDEAQECLDENGDMAIQKDIARMDDAIKALMAAAEALEGIEN